MRPRLFLVCLTLAACGGNVPAAQSAGSTTVSEPTGTPSTGGGPPPQDQVFTLDAQPVVGTVFVPEVLAEPEVSWSVPGGRTVADQRKIYARAKGPARFAEGEALAALLWTGGGGANDRAEAMKILAELAATTGAPDDLVEKAAMLQLGLGHDAEAATLFTALATRGGKTEAGARWTAYRAYLHLRANENVKAAALLAGIDAATQAKVPEVEYVAAWLKLRAGDLDGARGLIVEAEKAWPETPNLARLQRELMMISARAGADTAPTVDALARGASKTSPAIIKLLGGLADAYLYAGEYDKRGGVLQMLGVATPTPDVLAFVYFYQSDVQYRMNRPDTATARLIDAWGLVLTAGGGVPEKFRGEIAERMFELAAIYHRVYASNFDRRYGEAAKTLFAAYIAIKPAPPLLDDAQKRAQSLDALLAAEPVGAGLADKDEVVRRVFARREQLSACYERYLQVDRALAGNVQVTFDINLDGTVSTVDTVPAGGPAGLPAVAACVSTRMKTWTFAKRSRPGITRVIYPLTFALKK